MARALGLLTTASISIVGVSLPPTGAALGTPGAAAVSAADSPDDLTGDITFSVPSGTFQGTISVSLGTSVSHTEIRYTTDGTLPGATATAYDGTPVSLTGTTQLRAQAFLDGLPSGSPGTAIYVARAVEASLDLPILVLDGYGRGEPDREFVDAAVMVFEPTAGSASLSAPPSLVSRAGFHLHGTSSSLFDKTPYRIEFRDNEDDDVDYPVLGMPAESDWVLRGPYTDKALIREALTFDLARGMGLHAPRYSFVEFYRNVADRPLAAGDYMGVYMLVETIKNSKNRLDLKELDPDDITPPDVEGGYIFKFDWLTAEEPTLRCIGAPSTCWHYLEVVDPEPLQPAQQDWLTQHLQQFNNLMQTPGFANPTTGYSAWIDVGSFVDGIIVNELTRNIDAYARSSYFYKDRGGKITSGPVWDFDLTYGVGGGWENLEPAGWQYEQTRRPIPNNWVNRLVLDPAFVNLLKARWAQLRQGALSDAALDARIAGLTAPLVNAAERNFQRWPNLTDPTIGPIITPTADTWQGQVAYMRDWMDQRMAWLDSPAGWGG